MKTLTLLELEKFLNVNSNLAYESLDNETIKDNKIEGLQYSGCKITGSTYNHVIFENCDFYGCQFNKTEFIDCIFINCKFNFTHMQKCNFESCQFEGTALVCSTFKKCSLQACDLDQTLSEHFGEEEASFHYLDLALAA
ncbi:MAG: pentapeptide repeat-containing protein [Bacteriovoracaceae bacterium]